MEVGDEARTPTRASYRRDAPVSLTGQIHVTLLEMRPEDWSGREHAVRTLMSAGDGRI